jgi:glycosyltransferase involved in cell wall biosynthesis
VPLQAGAMECALILSDINGCNEIVEEGENGLLVPPKEVEPLIDAMQKVRSDPALRDRFGKKSRERIQSLYSREEIWKLIEAEYREMLLVVGC